MLKFFVVGITFYGMSTFEGPMLSIKAVNALSHYTDWTIAHVHGGALGWNGFMTFGMIYWLAPRLFQTRAPQREARRDHFWLATLGILVYVVSMYVAGVTAGPDVAGRSPRPVSSQYPNFVETSQAIIPMYYWVRLRSVAGCCTSSALRSAAGTSYKTWQARPGTLRRDPRATKRPR